MTAAGVLLLFMALTAAYVRRWPISTAIIYLMAGFAIGPTGFALLTLDIVHESVWMEVLTEIAVIISLFVGGLKLRLPLRHRAWRPAFLLASVVMVMSIAGVSVASHFLFGLPAFASILLGAVLAPTDPVLASAVSVSSATDHDRVRFALSGEAGLNDGAAFPFVVFALEGLRAGGLDVWVGTWFASRILWAIPAGLLIGYVLGAGLGRVAMALRSKNRDTHSPNDFFALALIALSYVLAERVHAWGFLSVFAAGVGLRHAELNVVAAAPKQRFVDMVQRALWRVLRRGPEREAHHKPPHPPAEHLVTGDLEASDLDEPSIAAGMLISDVLSFGNTVERLLEVLLVVLVGIALSQAFTLQAAVLAVLLFVVIRPAATMLALRGTRTTVSERRLLGWFGIRGIGSLYYLSYALNHGVAGEAADVLTGIVITVIACSITLHGASVGPIAYRRALRRLDSNQSTA